MILEAIVTTADNTGRVNIAPMGPHVDGPAMNHITLFPFESSTTCRNLTETRRAVIHVTDDVRLFAHAAVDHVDPHDRVTPVFSDTGKGFWRLLDCHRWFAVRVDAVKGEAPRWEMPCSLVDEGTVRPFFGFNRAKHAVIEASILATRLHLIPPDEVRRQFDALRVLVDKTAGKEERVAFDWLDQRVRAKIEP